MSTDSESQAPESVGEFVEYGEATAVWVDDGHVFASREDGTTVRMSPEVAIAIGRKLEAAGTESFINKVMDGHIDDAGQEPGSEERWT